MGRHGTGLSPYLLAFAEKYERGNALHSELRRGTLVTVDVYLYHFQFAIVLACYLLYYRVHGFARSAPVSVKIHQNRHARAVY